MTIPAERVARELRAARLRVFSKVVLFSVATPYAGSGSAVLVASNLRHAARVVAEAFAVLDYGLLQGLVASITVRVLVEGAISTALALRVVSVGCQLADEDPFVLDMMAGVGPAIPRNANDPALGIGTLDDDVLVEGVAAATGFIHC